MTIPVVIIVVTVPIIAPVIVAVTSIVAVSVAVPIVVMFKPATVAFPIAFVELIAFIARSDPPSAIIGRSSPVAFMPTIATVRRIPVAINPDVIRSWPWWVNSDGSRRWWRTDPNTNGHL